MKKSTHPYSLLPTPYSLLLTPYFLLLTTCSLLLTSVTNAQSNIPIGTWRLHLSYNSIKSVALGDDKVFGASESGILVFDRTDNSISSLNTLTGLSGTGINAIAYDDERSQLLIGYSDGGIDIVNENTVTHFSRLKNSTTVTGSKKINHIAIHGQLGYLSTDYGVVVFDLQKLELKETWRDLGVNGDPLAVQQLTFKADSIFLATASGVMMGDLNNNLLDFNNWRIFNTGEFSSAVQSIATFNSMVYAAINNNGIFRYENGTWIKESFLQNEIFNSLYSNGSGLLIAGTVGVFRLTPAGVFSAIESKLITMPLSVIEDEQQVVWIGDQRNGLTSDLSGNFFSYRPNGPSVNRVSRLRMHSINGSSVLAALPGGYSSTGQPLENPGALQLFENGQWRTELHSIRDLTDYEILGSSTFLSSFGDGMNRTENAEVTTIDHTNSPLENVDPAGRAINITALQTSGNELWVANYGASKPLHVFNGNQWQSFTLCCAARYPTDMVVDFSGHVWTVISPLQGGGVHVFDPEDASSRYRTETAGNGGLPHQNVHSIAIDRDGYVWVGTDQGVAYFTSPETDAFKPVFGNKFLLRDEKITAIEVDGGNRKWIGTERGLWLFNSTGEKLIENFTPENSPLLSGYILDIAVDNRNGEIFFATEKGIVSYRAGATAGEENFNNLKIFPNPVTASFTGTVGISGLATDSIVKITDVSGNLIWQTQANGGTATWNVRDYNGRRAATGIYLVFAASADGSDREVGKIAVVE